MNFLVYGSLNIDKVFAVDHITAPAETQSSLSLHVNAGGKGANQAIALAKAGAKTYMAGKIGENGIWLKKILKDCHVLTEFVSEDAEYTGEAIIQVDKEGQNCIILYPGGNFENTPQEMKSVLYHFNKDDWIICQNEISNLTELLSIAHEKGLKICLNPSPFNEKILNLPLKLVDLLMVNEIEGRAMAMCEKCDMPYDTILNNLVVKYPDTEIIMTVGSDGAFYACGAIRAFVKGKIVNVVDTTAAGDTFTGYYLACRYLYNLNVQDSLEKATKAASITVSRPGAISAIPFYSEVFSELCK